MRFPSAVVIPEVSLFMCKLKIRLIAKPPFTNGPPTPDFVAGTEEENLTAGSQWLPWLRTNGVNTNGAAAKVTNLDRLGKKPGTFEEIKAGARRYPKSPSAKKTIIFSDPISADPISQFPTASTCSRRPCGLLEWRFGSAGLRTRGRRARALLHRGCTRTPPPFVPALRELGGAPRNPAPRNHFFVRIVKPPGCHCTDAFRGKGYRKVPTPPRSSSPFSDLALARRRRAGRSPRSTRQITPNNNNNTNNNNNNNSY